VATSIAGALEKDGIVVTRAAAVAPGRTTLVIPAGAAATLAAAQPLDLKLHTGAEETRADADLRFRIFKALVGFAVGVKPTDPAGPLAIVPADVGAKAQPVTAGFQRSVPSYMV